MARRGCGRRPGARRGSVFCKRRRELVVFDISEGTFRSAKRRYLVDEESDMLSVEAVEQPHRSP
ncbi:UNVERIFIED_CONTAM: hypothetical protein Sangu_1709600 [Sesamum angustifolium]|uniref:Uncharacterized protein n=1 Tax=Sesamum angustifolium TaxID=2727405 RepID=A0AAW2MMC4_9LAMI